jgi:small-conductance mechanosensitive channel
VSARRARRLRPNARRRRQPRRRRRGSPTTAARTRLRFFRQSTLIAVAFTGLLLLLFAPDETGEAQTPATSVAETIAAELPDTVAVVEEVAAEELQGADTGRRAEGGRPDSLARAGTEEAADTLRDLLDGLVGNLPKIVISLGVLFVAGLLVRALRWVLRRVSDGWERGTALTALSGVVVWLFAIGIVVSILAGDIRALVGSIGLVGLALSWALQTPIESFTGWLMNSFQGYYRVGDRVAVGEIFGDVYRIDFLTTTVWEIGGADRPGFVQAEQPTGRLITFPNNEVLAGSIVNLTRDFPYVWDELGVPVGNRSDLQYAVDLLRELSGRLLGGYMAEPAAQYEAILRRARLEMAVAAEPQLFVSLDDSWTTLTIRYLVGARERRVWKSRLAKAVMEELNRPEHAERILSVFPRRQIQFIGPDGRPREPGWPDPHPSPISDS